MAEELRFGNSIFVDETDEEETEVFDILPEDGSGSAFMPRLTGESPLEQPPPPRQRVRQIGGIDEGDEETPEETKRIRDAARAAGKSEYEFREAALREQERKDREDPSKRDGRSIDPRTGETLPEKKAREAKGLPPPEAPAKPTHDDPGKRGGRSVNPKTGETRPEQLAREERERKEAEEAKKRGEEPAKPKEREKTNRAPKPGEERKEIEKEKRPDDPGKRDGRSINEKTGLTRPEQKAKDEADRKAKEAKDEADKKAKEEEEKKEQEKRDAEAEEAMNAIEAVEKSGG